MQADVEGISVVRVQEATLVANSLGHFCRWGSWDTPLSHTFIPYQSRDKQQQQLLLTRLGAQLGGHSWHTVRESHEKGQRFCLGPLCVSVDTLRQL